MSDTIWAAIIGVAGVGISILVSLIVARIDKSSKAQATDVETNAQLLIQLVQSWKDRTEAAVADAANAKSEAAQAKALAQQTNDDLATERGKRQEQDRVIAGLRRGMRVWAEWAKRIHDEWPRVRQGDAAPPLPSIDDAEI